ncbi:hypothetical protein YC2023_026278 [Brassica napus]
MFFCRLQNSFWVEDKTVIDCLWYFENQALNLSKHSLLKKLKVQADDLEVQVISISNAEVLNLLRASLVTSSALSSAFRSLLVKGRLIEPYFKETKDREA